MDLDHTVLDKENSTYGFLTSGLQPRASPPVQRCPEVDWLSKVKSWPAARTDALSPSPLTLQCGLHQTLIKLWALPVLLQRPGEEPGTSLPNPQDPGQIRRNQFGKWRR